MSSKKVKPTPKPRNKLEQANWDLLSSQKKISWEYETKRYQYNVPGTYTPDFSLSNGTLIECKGFFREEDKRKLRAVKQAYPELDLRIVFDEAKYPSQKKALDRNIKWANKYGFPYAIGLIPKGWLK